MDKYFKRLAVLSTVVMFIVMIAGSLVTKTGSGLGCGNDWPLCNGKWVPAYTIESLIEYTHRLTTGLAGIVVIVFSVWAWLRYKGNKEVRGLAIFGMFFIVVESLLGASAVMWPQSSPVLALHFGFSLLAYTGVFLLTLFALNRERSAPMIQTEVPFGVKVYTWFTALFAYGVIYLGAYVRHTGSNLACPDWPLCQGQLIPDLSAMDGNVGVQYFHRLAAGVLYLMLMGLFIYIARHYRNTRQDLYKTSKYVFILITAQVLSGGLVVFTKLNLSATMLHSAIITVMFSLLCHLCMQVMKRPEQEYEVEKVAVEQGVVKNSGKKTVKTATETV
ncbi:COX15/CtaA family protein [Brevibacillus dissolubilis]|uniref:COX15/CtaA family protein n=1 Tax=Brevibacillus dissolubilis TaxID=1844116 RepID=UPI001117904E|nr:heme A synthase [Brevibacillus dissolubilis]